MTDSVATTATPTGAGGNPPPQAEPSWYSQLLTTFGRMFLIYYGLNYFMGNFTKQPQQDHSPLVGPQPDPAKVTTTTTTGSSTTTPGVKPNWPFGTKLNLQVYVTEENNFTDFRPDRLFWQSEYVEFGSYEYQESVEGIVKFSPKVQNNGTLYAQIYLVRQGASYDPMNPDYDPTGFVHLQHALTRYHPQRKEIKKKKLLGGGSDEVVPEDNEKEQRKVEMGETETNLDNPQTSTEESTKSEVGTTKMTESTKGTSLPIISYWHTNLTLSLVNHEKTIPTRGLPPPVLEHFKTIPVTNAEEALANPTPIFPVLFLNEFWVLRSNLQPINDTTTEMPFNIHFGPLSMWKFQLLAAMDVQLKSQMAMMGGDTNELDLIKSTLMDTNPWLLGVTMVVSILHSLFDFLAFKNDIAFWKGKKDSIGVSVRTLMMNIVFQVIIFLYLLDNSENTSWMILASNGVGLAIEGWKVKQALNARLVRQTTGWLPYKFIIEAKEKSDLEDKTDEYDSMAYQYLSYAAYPLLFIYAIYSIFYEDHKGWYSFIINTAVGFVYTFGFITMTPQLFINYKLQSVAHMPWRTFMYKSLNTFVDDLFAFVIKMPTLHRLACLRDDVVFFVYLYQRWIYREDPNRPNEFGQVSTTTTDPPAIEATTPVESKKTQ